MHLYAYKPGSRSAKALAEQLPAKRIKHHGSRFRGNPNKTVINWGATRLPEEALKCRLLNQPMYVQQASNKLSCCVMTEMYSVPFTSSYDGALHWIEEGETVVCRTVLNGHSGKGIVIAETVDELVDAPLYTKYIKKKSEWRVHIFNGQVIDIQRKVRNNDVEEVNWRVRNHANGFIYQRNNLAPPDCVLKAAVGAMNLTLLDFGAVDVIYNEHYDKAYVLEINCAPGLEGTTVERYVEAFRAL